jgi:hypothetical protein
VIDHAAMKCRFLFFSVLSLPVCLQHYDKGSSFKASRFRESENSWRLSLCCVVWSVGSRIDISQAEIGYDFIGQQGHLQAADSLEDCAQE